MSVTLICPFCGTPAPFYRTPVSLCPQCQTALPEPLRQSAEAALTREKVGRPLLLTIGMYVAPAFSGFFLLLCPQCQTALPEPLRQSAEAALTREKVGRPLLLTIGMYVAPAFSGFFLLL